MKSIFLLFFFLSQIAFAGGTASDAGNGGGLAEKNVDFAYTHLPEFINLCLNTSLCRIDETETKTLKLIEASLSTEEKTPLDFRSGMKAPKFFKIEGLIRVAKTGDHVGDPIFINQDLLYSKMPSGFPVAVDVPLSVSILIHELGHHHGIKDHSALDRLGSHVQTMLLTNLERSEFWNGNASLVVYQFNSVHSDADKTKINSLDQLILENEGELYSLTAPLVSHLKCADGKTPLGVRIYNVSSKRGTHFDEKTNIITKPFEGWFIETCSTGQEYDHGDFSLDLNFKKFSEGHFEFLADKTEFKISACRQNKEVCR